MAVSECVCVCAEKEEGRRAFVFVFAMPREGGREREEGGEMSLLFSLLSLPIA